MSRRTRSSSCPGRRSWGRTSSGSTWRRALPGRQGPGVRRRGHHQRRRREEAGPRGGRGVRSARQLHRQVHEEAVQAEVRVKPASDAASSACGAKSWTLLASYLDQTTSATRWASTRVAAKGQHLLDAGQPLRRAVRQRPVPRLLPDDRVGQDRRDRVESSETRHDHGGRQQGRGPSLDFQSTKGRSSSSSRTPTSARWTKPIRRASPREARAIKSRINAFESKLYSPTTRDEYQDFLDEASAIDFYLVKEFTKDNDADFTSSHYFSWDQTIARDGPLQDGKFHFGPAWDFDRSAGNVDPDTAGHTSVNSPTGGTCAARALRATAAATRYKTHWFVQLFKDAGFKTASRRDGRREGRVREDLTDRHGRPTGRARRRCSERPQAVGEEPKRYKPTFDGQTATTGGVRHRVVPDDRYNWIDANCELDVCRSCRAAVPVTR